MFTRTLITGLMQDAVPLVQTQHYLREGKIMIKQLLTIVAILTMAAGIANASGGKIVGVVTASSSGKPISFASVQIEDSNLGTMADSTGRFVLTHVPVGTQDVVISAVGYQTRRLTVTVTENAAFELATTLKATRINIGRIVVTGTRTPRFIGDVPVRTQVITKASIEKKSASNIFEALTGEPGVRVEQQCQGCNFSILRMQGLGADHTQILLDGQPIYSGLASVYGLQQLSTADIDQIEIVKGAGSALYGSNAVAGAINIISSVPQETKGNIGIETGEYGTRKLDFTASTRKDKIGIFVFAQHNKQDEIDQTGDINASGGVDNPDGWIDRVRTSSGNLGFNLFVDDVFTSDQLVFRGRHVNEIRDGGWLRDDQFLNRFAPGTESIITDRYSGELSYKIWFKNGSELNSDITITQHSRDATNDAFLSDYEDTFGESPAIGLLKPYVAEEKLIIGGLNFIHAPIKRHSFLTGIQISHNKLNESGMYVDFDQLEAYRSTSTKKSLDFGAYLQDEFKLTKTLELVAGIRFDYHNSEDEFRGSGNVLSRGLEPLEYEETSFNPRFSIKYAVVDRLNIRGSIGTGFRVPYGFSEDLHLCSGSPRVYKGVNLKPEKSLSYSISTDYVSPTLTAGVSLYRTELTNAIAFADAEDAIANMGYTYEWQNIDNAYVMGAEFDAAYSLTDDIACGVRFEIFEGKYDNSREDWMETDYEDISRNISRYPSTSGGVNFEYTPSGWDFILDIDYKGKMYIDLTEPANEEDIKIHETESFAIIDARISKTFYEKYSLYVGAKNLNDYTQKEKHIDDAAFMYAPVYGRVIYGGMKVAF